MRNVSFIFMFFLIQALALSQPCLPEGITFTTQAQIDSFQINYPGCTDIEGNVLIGKWGASTISNLNGLNVLTSIGGNLVFCGNDYLISLTGLDNLISIGGDLDITHNYALINLQGLDSLSSIGGSLIVHNPAIISLLGLDNLNFIGESLVLGLYWVEMHNYSLTSIASLKNVTYIGGDIKLNANTKLPSLAGLDNITTINGNLIINSNDSLENLSGLNNVISIVGDIVIWRNKTLNNLIGLDNVSSIGGDIHILSNYSMTSLKGVYGLKSIGGSLVIGSIDEYYFFWNCMGNDSLIDLTGLESLNTIGNNLEINCNQNLVSLKGLENVVSISGDLIIGDFDIYNNGNELGGNPSLSICNISPICNYLTNPSGSIIIEENKSGCNSQSEIQEACDTLSIAEINFDIGITVSPNPFTTSTTFSYTLDKPQDVQFTVYNVQSKIVYSIQEKQPKGQQQVQWNAEGLPAGIYYFRIRAGDKVGGGKMVKVR